jgi:DNA polymerase III epsilon subunit
MLAALALLLVACLAVDVYLLTASRFSASQLVLVLVLQGALLMAAIALFWSWLETRLLHPLRVLEDDIDLIVHGNPHHSPAPPAGHGLGGLPDAVDRLAGEYSRARADTSKAMHSARSLAERRSARLEAILRDLSEAVIVCTQQHRVVLHNQAASQLLAGSGKLGIGRMLTSVVQPAALRAAFTELNRRHRGDDGSRGVVTCELEHSGPGQKRLPGRMRLVVEHDGSTSGYVLVLGGAAHGPAHEDSGQTAVGRAMDLLERPVFYDFDLFDQDLDRALLDTPLACLNLVVFDTETTGLEPSRGDQIVQIAGVRVLNARLLPDDRFDELVNPGMPIPRASTRIHGIRDHMVAGKDSVAEVLRRFHAFVGDAVLVAHNAAFDMKFLQLQEQEVGARFEQAVLDTFLLSVVLQPRHGAHTLDAIANRFGVENHHRHSALGDSMTTAEVFVKMIDVLAARGIRNLGQALEASDRIQEIKRLQGRF